MKTRNSTTAQDQTETVEEGLFVRINGLDQWLTIRGNDRTNPVLLVLGGPGSALSRMAPFFAPWEHDFTLVQWDQPGAGATFAKNGGALTGPLALDRIARDGIAGAEFVAAPLHADKVVVLGISGGSIIGLKMIKQRPDLFAAYVGTGQCINWARQEALSYAMVLEQARARAVIKAPWPNWNRSARLPLRTRPPTRLSRSTQAPSRRPSWPFSLHSIPQ